MTTRSRRRGGGTAPCGSGQFTSSGCTDRCGREVFPPCAGRVLSTASSTQPAPGRAAAVPVGRNDALSGNATTRRQARPRGHQLWWLLRRVDVKPNAEGAAAVPVGRNDALGGNATTRRQARPRGHQLRSLLRPMATAKATDGWETDVPAGTRQEPRRHAAANREMGPGSPPGWWWRYVASMVGVAQPSSVRPHRLARDRADPAGAKAE